MLIKILTDTELRSSRSEVFCKTSVLRNFAKFTGKHLCQSLFFNKVAGLRSASLSKKRIWNKCFPVNFAKFLGTLFLTEHLWWLLLRTDKSLQILNTKTIWEMCTINNLSKFVTCLGRCILVILICIILWFLDCDRLTSCQNTPVGTGWLSGKMWNFKNFPGQDLREFFLLGRHQGKRFKVNWQIPGWPKT